MKTIRYRAHIQTPDHVFQHLITVEAHTINAGWPKAVKAAVARAREHFRGEVCSIEFWDLTP